jgi:ELWxxDGT repeat protein
MKSLNSIESLENRRLLSNSILADFQGIYPTETVTLNGVSYFAANDGVHGMELWKSDGTQEGTQLVRDLVPGTAGSEPGTLSVVNNRIVFLAVDQNNDLLAWSSDGTTNGTIELKDFGKFVWGPPPNYPMDGSSGIAGSAGHQKLVFDFSLIGGIEQTWSTDGTVGGTIKLADIGSIQNSIQLDMSTGRQFMPVSNGRVVFSDGQHLWSTDGTAGGMIDLDATSSALAASHGVPEQTFQYGDKVAFITSKGLYPQALWVTDGTANGTKLVTALDSKFGTAVGQTQFGIQVAGGKMYIVEKFVELTGNGQPVESELWASDGTAAGSYKLLTSANDQFGEIGEAGDKAVFVAPTSEGDYGLFISDGTPLGTEAIVNPIPPTGFFQFREAGGFDYFLTLVGRPHPNVGEGGHYQLWRTDGTAGGTILVSDMTEITEEKYVPRMTTANGKIAIELIRVGDPQEHIAKTLIVDPAHNAPPIGPAESSMTLKDSVLRVFGTRHSDTIHVYAMAADATRFVANLNGHAYSFAYSDVRKIVIYGYSGNDNISFSDVHGPIVLRALIYGGAGNDTIYGGDSRDTISGDNGNDVIVSGMSNDIVSGGDGNDSIDGGSGADTISGDDGADKINGESGTDLISGGDDGSRDSIDGGAGVDVIFGQAVLDIFYGTDKNGGISADQLLNS